MTVPTGNLVHKEAIKNPIERRMVDGFSAALQRALPATASRVLEVGCGEGRQLTAVGDRFPNAALVGLDLPDVELEDAWSAVPLQMVQASALDLPFADNTFDLVLAIEVLEHLPDP
ncbi:MAG: class I SAM-dependent methyltransferase, partial [Actinobacteria bacterium]|nr:class I SAM-dependent methyltransferase [Actinomycetota bacterium]